jgi:Tol biopolymer transport system component
VRERLQHIGDARADIAEALADLSEVRATEAAGRIPRLSWRRHLLVFVGSTVLVILAVVWAFRVASVDTQAPPAAARFSLQAAEAVPLTANGNSTLPAISPDGRYVAYVQSDANGDSLWLRQLTAPTPNRIVEARAGVRIVAVTLSPDYADFVVREASRMRLERVPLVGGKARHLMDDVHSAIAWEPGGRRFVFVRLNSASETSLVVADADGTNERQLRRTVPPEHSFLTLVHPEGAGTGPAWSPDGATIAVPGLGFVDRVRTGFVMFVNATSGSVTQQVPYTPSGPGGAWVDGTSLLWSRPGEDHAPGQLWSLSYPSAALRRLTNDLSNYGPVALSADRDLLVTTQDDTDTSISVGDGSWTRSSDLDTSAAVPVVASIAAQVTWSGDRLLYSGLSGGRLGLWGIRLGEAPEELMRAAHSPAATADGGFIYIAGPGYSLWRADPNGRNATKLADDAYWPVMTPGGSAVFVSASRASQSVTLWSVPLDGGGPTQIADADARNPDVSGDGKRLAFVSSDPQPGGGQQRDAVLVCDLPDCASIRRLTPPGLPAGNVPIRWTRDGRGIAYVNALATGGPNIWVQPVDGSAATPLTRFTDRRSILSFAWSRDFARLAILRARPSTDIVLFKGLIIPAGQKEKVQ